MATGAQVSNQAAAEIFTAIKILFDAWNSHDMAMYAVPFAEDADFVNVLGMHWRGRALIEARHVDLHRTIFRNSSLKILNCALRSLAPAVVLAHIEWEMKGHESPPGASFAPVRRGLITAVFVEQNGRWEIASFHNTDIVPISPPGDHI